MADFDRMMAEAKKRGIRVINDMVLNHTSDQHPWFKESASSKTNAKADWYVWRDGKGGGQPPNNWQSIFGHSAWQYADSRKQYYYHAFYKEQPDLNFRNNDVRKAMYDTLRFWMDKGVAGFRLDAITSLFEDPALRDDPYAGGMNDFGDRKVSRVHTDNLPEIHEVLREIRKVTNEYPGRVLIGEAYLPNVAELAKMYGQKRDELQLPMDLQLGFTNRLSAAEFRRKLGEAETKINGNVPLFAFSNHDNPRSIDRYGDGKHNASIARLLATMLLASRGAALIYYGEELGMVDNTPTRKEDVQDPKGKTGWPKDKGRDGERTPMQWNSERHAGFSDGASTWLPVAPNYRTVNVANERQKPDSLLNYYRELIRLRKENAALREGDFTLLNRDAGNVLSFIRGSTVVVALNLSDAPRTVSIGVKGRLRTLLASFPSARLMEPRQLKLDPYGSYVGQVEP
jgi:alpha-glucosidase